MTTFRGRAQLVATFVAGCLIACPLTAQSQTWTAPHFIENGGPAVVATNGSQTSAVIAGGSAAVSTSGIWGAPVTLTSAAQISTVAVAPNGDVLAVWSFRTTNTYIPNEAQASFYRGGHWSNPITISTNVYGNVYSYGLPSIGFDGNSRATLVWEQINNSPTVTCSLMAVTGTAASGFSSPQVISNGSTCYGWTKLAVNRLGAAVVVEGVPGILSGAVVAISRGANGSWSAPVTLEASQYRQRQPRVALGDDGTAVAVWTQRTADSYATRSPGGIWSAAAVVPSTSNITNTSYVAVDGSGNAVIAYQQYQLPNGLSVNYRPAGGHWQTPVLLQSSAGPIGAVATPAGTFVVASGDAIYLWSLGMPAWEKTSFSYVSSVAAAPGLAIAAVGPQVSVSTVSVP
jgi:hypothetical protein